MQLSKSLRIAVVTAVAGAALAVGISAAVTAGAGDTSTTYYACLRSGRLTGVGTTPPTCKSSATQISWDSVGPQGVAGPQGPAGPQGDPGPQGVAGPQGPAGVATLYSDLVHSQISLPAATSPGTTNFVAVATKSVPAGNYLIESAVSLLSVSGVSMGINCEVTDGSAEPAFASSILPANGNGTQTTLSMMGTLTESATTTLTLQCGSFLDSAAFAQSGTSLEAIPVTAIS
jgi:hypothetical protein